MICPAPDVSHGASPADVVKDREEYLSMQAPKTPPKDSTLNSCECYLIVKKGLCNYD